MTGDSYGYDYPAPTPQPAPQAPKKKKYALGLIPVGIIAAFALFIGAAIGMSGDPAPTAAPAPNVTVTAQPTPAPTVTVTNEVVPEACEDFADDSDELVAIMADVIGLAGEGFDAVSNSDSAELTRITQKINDKQEPMSDAIEAYKSSKSDCTG